MALWGCIGSEPCDFGTHVATLHGLCSPRWDWCLSQTVLRIVVRISERSRSDSRNLRHSLVSRPSFIPVAPASRAAQRHEEFAVDSDAGAFAESVGHDARLRCVTGNQPYSDQGD